MTDSQPTIQSILTPELTVTGFPGSSKKKVLEQVSHLVARAHPELDPAIVFDSLINRERLGSTGIGQGIAIPHCRIEETEEIIGALVVLKDKVPFDAIDDAPVDLLFVLIVPKEANSQHLELLSQIAETFNQPEFCNRLRQCKSNEELYNTVISH